MKNFFSNIENAQVLGPKNRVETYLAYCGHIFNFKNVKFINNLNEIIENDYILFIDQKRLSENFIKLQKKNIKLIIILLWNADRDYFLYKKNIDYLKKNFNLKLISFSNFSEQIYFPLNRFKVNRKNSLKNISGVKVFSKMKYLFPLIYSFYNAIIYFKYAKKLLFRKKLVFVGIGNKNDAIIQLNKIAQENYSKEISDTSKKLLSIIKKNNLCECLEKTKLVLYSKTFQKIHISFKYYLSQVVFRYLLLEYLSNFKNFYHKNNSSLPFDPLKSRIYNKIFHLELGSQSGNTKIHTRKIYLEKFFFKKYLEINFFKNNNNYKNNEEFKKVLKKYFLFLEKIYLNKNYDLITEDLIFFLKNSLRDVSKI